MIAWLDASREDQRCMREIVNLFAQSESRDELGIGQVRDAFSDFLFPGISTLHTRGSFRHTAPAAGDEEAIERKIAVRAARQERLTADDPPEFCAVLNEAAIRRVVRPTRTLRLAPRHAHRGQPIDWGQPIL